MTSLFPENTMAGVLVSAPVDRVYSYAVPDGMILAPGDVVLVPLGSRTVPGVVWDGAPDAAQGKKLKAVIARCDVPPVKDAQRRFVDWVAQYTMSPKGFVLKMALSVPQALERGDGVVAYRIAPDAPSPPWGEGGVMRLSPRRRNVLAVLEDGKARTLKDLVKRSGSSAEVIRSMAKEGLLETVSIDSPAPCSYPDFTRPGPSLSPAQHAAAEHLREAARKGSFHAALLDGVTGAGKTEVYFEAMAEALRAGRQALLMLPEIALSNAFLDRFESRFGCRPALWHSALTPAQRRKTWRGVAEGRTKVIVGARSALFLPFPDLGMIVVDEEHDPAYKQEDNVIYNARDMAVVRAHLEKIPVVLVSATPSLETMANAWAGRYTHLHLPGRHGGAALPDVQVIDMKADKPERQHFIAPTLRKALDETLSAGEQSLLFLNRRGYAPLTLCRTCGHRMDCPRCTAWLVEHKKRGRLECHHCGYGVPMPKICPSCGDAGNFAACGPGVERVLEEVKEYFPEARTVVLASDTAENQDELRRLLQEIRDHAYDIIIGTQIIAKGHHFPKLTLVGVVDADIGLKGGDLRAAERTYQLLHQVAGRAGREKLQGRVFLQTFYPRNKVMQSLTSNERDAFLEAEAQERESAQMPPYSRLAAIIVAGKQEAQVRDVAKALGASAPHGPGIQTFGPADAPLYRLRGLYRRRLLVRADKELNIQKALAEWVGGLKVPASVRVYIDIDPQSFL